jgi:hypothetical protein
MPCGHRGYRRVALAFLAASLSFSGLTACSRPGTYLGAIPVAQNLTNPVFVAAPPGDPRLFVVEKRGRVKVIDPVAKTVIGTYLDIVTRVGTGGDRGLASIAFPPDFAESGHFYALYQQTNGDTVLSRFVAADPADNAVSPASERQLLTTQTAGNTFLGGGLRFGPDGMLYIGIGDSRPDPGTGDSQLVRRLRGKLLRIDVSGGPDDRYRIPSGNPFPAPALPELWAIGVHDPMRIDFDPDTGDLWVTDRGLDFRDEVNVLPAGVGGQNLGWPAHEGDLCARVLSGMPCDNPVKPTRFLFPMHDFPYGPGCRVVGGYAYAGGLMDLRGAFAFADACTTHVSLLAPADMPHPLKMADVTDVILAGGPPFASVSAIASDGFGEPYLVSNVDGTVYRIQVGYDLDADGIPEPSDNCPFVSNRDQLDSNDDGIGDACADVGT